MLRKTSLHRKGERNGEPQREPCLSCTVHLSAPEKASKPFPRISIRNGFTRPTGDINVNSPLFTKRAAREEVLTENLFVLPSPPVGWRPLSITATFASAVHFRFAVPREANRTEYDFAFVVNVAGEASVVREKVVLFLMGSSIPIALCLAARFSATVKGGSDPMKLLGGFTTKKWGRSHPI